jgi:hypothetical protein
MHTLTGNDAATLTPSVRQQAEPFIHRGNVEGGLVADGELVIPGGDSAVALEPVDPAFKEQAGLHT